MKDRIREWNPRQQIKVKYQIDKTHFAYWETTVNKLYTQISSIVDAYQKKSIKLSNRQLYYRLVGKNWIPNRIEIYKRICVFLTDCRYGGYIDWDAIEDRGRTPERRAQWETVQSLIDSAIASYRLPRWKDQEYYVELYCEKEAMESVLRPIADKYHIYFGYNKGYSSASTIHEVAERVYKQIQNKKTVTVLYLGDHDPSGLDMVRDIEERIMEFVFHWWAGGEEDEYYLSAFKEHLEEVFSVEHVALTTEQVKQYNPPPNPAKFTDPRANEYISVHGEISWELDSLEPEVLIQLTEKAILEVLDADKYNAWIKQEGEEKKALFEFGKFLKKQEEEKKKKESKNMEEKK